MYETDYTFDDLHTGMEVLLNGRTHYIKEITEDTVIIGEKRLELDEEQTNEWFSSPDVPFTIVDPNTY